MKRPKPTTRESDIEDEPVESEEEETNDNQTDAGNGHVKKDILLAMSLPRIDPPIQGGSEVCWRESSAQRWAV